MFSTRDRLVRQRVTPRRKSVSSVKSVVKLCPAVLVQFHFVILEEEVKPFVPDLRVPAESYGETLLRLSNPAASAKSASYFYRVRA